LSSPLVLLHGFSDTWRTWDLVRPALEREHDVLAVRLAGHHGGPPVGDDCDLAGPVEAELDARGWETAHLVGNSLGGYLALRLAERGRARSVVALAPAADPGPEILERQRRGAILPVVAHPERVPAELLTPMPCPGRETLVDGALRDGWPLEPERIACPVRIVWGTEDRLLEWPDAAARYRDWFPQADWIELDGIGHAPQLDAPLETAQLILGFTGS
jgi:pimeloyl-ACP methyl ester carboxylesterase